jgi:hypothetical protein
MPKKAPAKRSKKSATQKKKYKVRNWKEYNESLVNRGSLEFWIEQGARVEVEIIHEDGRKRKRGAQVKYSEEIITFSLTLGAVFHQRLRQTEGFARSVVKMAKLKWKTPDFTTLCRRRKTAPLELPVSSKEEVVAILDSTGFKVYGEGEWKVRKHGYSKHRTWTKVHLSVDRDGEIRVVKTTDNGVDDATAGVELLSEETAIITDVPGDGAYDKAKMYAAIQAKGARALIPPRKDARIWKHGNTKGEKHPRDENLRAIRRTSRKKWKEQVGYHQRSGAENTIFRLKTVFTDRLYARTLESQEREAYYRCRALNVMTKAGMPDSYAVSS